MYIYIYTEREREVHACVYTYIYIYVHIYTHVPVLEEADGAARLPPATDALVLGRFLNAVIIYGYNQCYFDFANIEYLYVY